MQFSVVIRFGREVEWVMYASCYVVQQTDLTLFKGMQGWSFSGLRLVVGKDADNINFVNMIKIQ